MEDLSRFVKAYGDRMALKQYCVTKVGKGKMSKKNTLLEKLKQKIKKKRTDAEKENNSSSDEDNIPKRSKHGNIKNERQIELGWFCGCGGAPPKQVRTRLGGGVRKVSISKNARKFELIHEAKELFFPNGISSKGHINRFSVDLWDFKSCIVNEDMTVDNMYKLCALSRLRFYLVTKEKEKCETITSQTFNTVSVAECVDDDYSTGAGVVPDPTVWQDNSSYALNEFLLFDAPSGEITFEVCQENQLNMNLPIEAYDSDFTVYLHRGRVFSELIEVLMHRKIKGKIAIKMILPNGEEEIGIDTGGVFRDALSEFTKEFYENCTLGTIKKVPYIRHDFDAQKWSAIAAIFRKGWEEVKYFPIDLCNVFVERCIFTSTQSDILISFFQYLSRSDEDVLKKAIEKFDDIDLDDILEVLSALECKVIPSDTTIEKIVRDIAHKELIQKPMFVINCWRPVLQGMLTYADFEDIYKTQEVTTKNVLSLFVHDTNLTANESKCFTFLKKYIKECEKKELQMLLRFCTGADIITKNFINVRFNTSSGFLRTPKAQTCTCSLELPDSYDNYVDFKSEMNGLLTSNVWIMDRL